MFDICADIKTLLTLITSDIFLYEQPPDLPDACLTISPNEGYEPVHTMGMKKSAFEQPIINILVRHTSIPSSLSWVESIKDVLDGVCNVTINSHLYISVMQQGDIFNIGRDEQGRYELALNFELQVRR